MRGLSPVVAGGGHSSSRCAGLSLSRPLLLCSTSSRCAGSVVVAHGPSRSAACGILPDQGTNPCPLHWQADSQPLRHQGSPAVIFNPFHRRRNQCPESFVQDQMASLGLLLHIIPCIISLGWNLESDNPDSGKKFLIPTVLFQEHDKPDNSLKSLGSVPLYKLFLLPGKSVPRSNLKILQTGRKYLQTMLLTRD